MIDTHTHLFIADSFPDGESDAAVRRAIESGVEKMIMPNIDSSTIEPLMSLSSRFPGVVFPAMGLHPTEVAENYRDELAVIKHAIREHDIKAVGEIGLDYYWDTTFRNEQKSVFREQLLLASELQLPVIIHQRAALDDTLDILRDVHPDVALVFHCFTGSVADVRKIREVAPDAYFGIGGVVTYKNAAELREALPEIGLDHILLETDSPYLAPVPKRGRRNESAYLSYICETIADTLGVSAEEVDEVTSRTACRIFSC